MKVIIAICCLFVLSACSSMLVGGGASGGQELGTDNRSSAQMQADARLTGNVRSRFAQDSSINRYNVGVTTRNSVVTLSGTVGSFTVRDHAVRIAGDTEGVRSVSNQIAVNTQLGDH